MCRTADLLDRLEAAVAADGPMLGDRIHPAAIEARQQRIAFARLSAALRLPAGEQDDGSRSGGAERRPQRRVGVRGVYAPRGVA